MSLHPLSRESNVKSSLKKFFVDALGSAVTFDTSLAAPDVRLQGVSAIKQWYNVDFGEFGRDALALFYFEVYCLSRQDPEGVELAKISDTLMGLLVDNSLQDGMRRIPLYDASEAPWELIGAMVIQDVWDAPAFEVVEDETKLKIFSVRLRWGAQI
jgi:hypothetical protein